MISGIYKRRITNSMRKNAKRANVIGKINKYESKVYFIKCNEYIKIGKADNLPKRLKQLQTSNPYELSIIGAISGNLDIEKEAHSNFKHLHHKGEWFKNDISIVNYIKEKCGIIIGSEISERDK
jgi:hypothetical protein